MKKEFKILNVKCGGCAHQINGKVTKINGVNSFSVDIETGNAVIEYNTEDTFVKVEEALAKMGYPTHEEDNTTLKKAKSYVSCMIGKVTKED